MLPDWKQFLTCGLLPIACRRSQRAVDYLFAPVPLPSGFKIESATGYLLSLQPHERKSGFHLCFSKRVKSNTILCIQRALGEFWFTMEALTGTLSPVT